MKELSRNKVVWMVKIALEDTVSARVVTFGDKLLPFQVHSYFLVISGWNKKKNSEKKTEEISKKIILKREKSK